MTTVSDLDFSSHVLCLFVLFSHRTEWVNSLTLLQCVLYISTIQLYLEFQQIVLQSSTCFLQPTWNKTKLTQLLRILLSPRVWKYITSLFLPCFLFPTETKISSDPASEPPPPPTSSPPPDSISISGWSSSSSSSSHKTRNDDISGVFSGFWVQFLETQQSGWQRWQAT